MSASPVCSIGSPSPRVPALDALRGIAALAVFVLHAGLRVSPDEFRDVMSRAFDLGSFGVLLFFLCSGYVVPAALERGGSLRAFAIKRAARLLPLYWVSLAAVVACYRLGVARAEAELGGAAVIGSSAACAAMAARPVPTVLAHVVMLQDFVGIPRLSEPYWTLSLELVFYIVVAVLHVGSALERSALVAARFLIVTLAVQLVASLAHLPIRTGNMAGLCLMFVGTVLERAHAGKVERRVWRRIAALAALTLVATTYGESILFHEPWHGTNAAVARLAALGLFAAVLARPDRLVAPGLVALGTISYSLYLIHPLVLALVPRVGPAWVSLGVWTLVLVPLSALTYHTIERPAIALGSRLARSRPRVRPATATGTGPVDSNRPHPARPSTAGSPAREPMPG
ncbi:MAG: acyltransferase [Isosphaeraceae bacterium]